MATTTRDITKSDLKPLPPVQPEIEQYQRRLFSHLDNEVLLQMERLAAEKNFPIVGRAVGVFLEFLTRCVAAKRIFELGSGFGYSAYWFCRGMDKGGKIVLTDGDKENSKLASRFLSEAGYRDKIDYHVGWAQEIFESTDGDFDIIYNDVDKDGYPALWKLVKARIRPGGLYIADNVLWGGRVVAASSHDDLYPGWTEAIIEHNKLIAHDPDFDFFINPQRDGVIVARRKI